MAWPFQHSPFAGLPHAAFGSGQKREKVLTPGPCNIRSMLGCIMGLRMQFLTPNSLAYSAAPAYVPRLQRHESSDRPG